MWGHHIKINARYKPVIKKILHHLEVTNIRTCWTLSWETGTHIQFCDAMVHVNPSMLIFLQINIWAWRVRIYRN